ncbi:hypothetical protein KY320_01935, partial [Candidatus Woesearchaeota archaeon]|nr:hypothetical protein [Candidatus Woesearchaeota archaeon]
FIRDINNNTIFEKNYLARDTAMVINTLYASPSPIVYNYPENISGFSIRFSSHRAQIKDKSSDMDEVAKIYWYADVLGKELDIPNIEKVETIEFCKADVLTARGVET